MKFLTSILLATSLLAGSAVADELRDKAVAAFKPLPSTLPAVKGNTVTPEKIALGKALYFDPRLSA